MSTRVRLAPGGCGAVSLYVCTHDNKCIKMVIILRAWRYFTYIILSPKTLFRKRYLHLTDEKIGTERSSVG